LHSSWQDDVAFYEFAQKNIHFIEGVSDSWYCLKGQNNTEVYYQERGIQPWSILVFSDNREAILYCISSTYNLDTDIKPDDEILKQKNKLIFLNDFQIL
jgi:hypothetical protein